MSRGPGRCQRRIVDLVAASAERRLSRTQLEAVLVHQEGFTESNVLRAIRALARDWHIGFSDTRRKNESFVSLPPKPKPLSEDEIFALLAEKANHCNAKEERDESRTRLASASDR
jgi:hypothetical protein